MAFPAIHVRDLRKRFHKRRRVRRSSPAAEWALAGVSFAVAPGIPIWQVSQFTRLF